LNPRGRKKEETRDNFIFKSIILYVLHHTSILLSYKMKNDMEVVCDRYEGKGNSYRVLVGNFVGKRLIGIP